MNRAGSFRYSQGLGRLGKHINTSIAQGNKNSSGIEVKSSSGGYHSGIATFKGKFDPDKVLLISSDGLPWQEFLQIDPNDLF